MNKSFGCGRLHRSASYGMDGTSMDIGDVVSLELVDQFCYLGDMLSVDGDDDAAVQARVCKEWNKF